MLVLASIARSGFLWPSLSDLGKSDPQQPGFSLRLLEQRGLFSLVHQIISCRVWQKSGACMDPLRRQPNVPRLLRFRNDRCATATIFNRILNVGLMHANVGQS
jgi:hypothetical protein